MNRVRTLAWAMLSLSTFWMSPTVVAADADHATRYPTKPVRVVVAHVGGGAVDLHGRAGGSPSRIRDR